MKKLIFSSLLLFFTICTQAQNANNFQKMVDFLPPAPNAAAIIKHSEISLNKNTGSPAINIPLFAVKGNKLSAGVSIGYSSTGIKVDEIASRAGMGWVLNAGGVITRTVRGNPDELTTRIAPPSTTAGDNCGTYNFLEQIASSTTTSGFDAEPDLFNFNMNGISGSFILDANMQPVLIPAEKYIIEKNFSGTTWNFKITATDGIIYYFGGTGATEKTKRNNTCGKTYDQFLANAWYLTKIEHPNGEVINLTYTPLTYTYETGISETKHWSYFMMDYRDASGAAVSCPSQSCPAPPPSSTCKNLVTTQGVLLSSISNSSTTVNFTYASRSDCTDQLISSITQLVNGQISGIFNLTYTQQEISNTTYLNELTAGQNYTPYLTELKENSPDLAFSKTHKFVYNDPGGRPPRLSFSQDHWGYFNGKVNATFIPLPTDIVLQQRFPTATANREPDPAFAGKGMLTKIVYPTGGIDNIDYESNEVKIDISQFQTQHEYNCSVTGTGGTTQVSKNFTFSIDKAQIAELDITSTTQDPANYDPIHMQGYVTVSGGGATQLAESFPAASPGVQYVRYLNSSWNLAPGTYTITYSAKGINQTTTIKLKYKPQTFASSIKNKIVGGVRVRRVMTGNPGEKPTVKKYYYAKMDELDASSLMPVPTPIYNKDYENATVCQMSLGGGSVPVNVYCQLTAMYSGSLVNLFNYSSGAISYNTVIEGIGENFEGGAVQTKFNAGSDVRPAVWWGNEILGATLSNLSSPLNGKVSEETVYKKPAVGALFPIKKTQYNYLLESSRARTKIYGYTINKKFSIVTVVPTPCGNSVTVPPSVINSYDAMRYDIDSWWGHVESQTETIYDENGQNPVTTTSNIFFDNEQHLQQTRTETLNSKNEWLKTTNTYVSDYSGGVYDAMKAKNIISPLITSKSENGLTLSSELSNSKINYIDAGNNNYVPSAVQKSVKGNALETEGTIDFYDAKGNILQFTNKAGIVSSIIWGYNYQYPVAQIVGATYANAIAQLTGGSVTALQSMDGAVLQSEINKIRTYIPLASITTYTYKPMAGVSTITDPNNKTNTYDYDSFNRLLTIKDQDGNFVKRNEYVYTVPNASATLLVYFNQALWQNYLCQTCLPGYGAAPVGYLIPFGKYISLISQADADAKTAADAGGQEYANRNAKCISNLICDGPEYKAINCTCEQGVRVCESTVNNGNGTYTVTYHYHFSDNTNSYSVTETISCGGIDKKFLNCVCETGSKVCDNTVNNGNGTYTITYHYHFSDNTNSQTVTETISCSGVDKKVINCNCETAIKVYTSSVYDKKGNMGCTPGKWLCTFHYHWSDGSVSGDFTECSATDCMNPIIDI